MSADRKPPVAGQEECRRCLEHQYVAAAGHQDVEAVERQVAAAEHRASVVELGAGQGSRSRNAFDTHQQTGTG